MDGFNRIITALRFDHHSYAWENSIGSWDASASRTENAAMTRLQFLLFCVHDEVRGDFFGQMYSLKWSHWPEGTRIMACWRNLQCEYKDMKVDDVNPIIIDQCCWFWMFFWISSGLLAPYQWSCLTGLPSTVLHYHVLANAADACLVASKRSADRSSKWISTPSTHRSLTKNLREKCFFQIRQLAIEKMRVRACAFVTSLYLWVPRATSRSGPLAFFFTTLKSMSSSAWGTSQDENWEARFQAFQKRAELNAFHRRKPAENFSDFSHSRLPKQPQNGLRHGCAERPLAGHLNIGSPARGSCGKQICHKFGIW